jgi:N-acetylmuramoyl-L-alanine amidase
MGHDDISPGRKFDPGPAFPMESLRTRLFGRAAGD